VAPWQIIGIWWHGFFQHLQSLFRNNFNLRHVANNVWIFDSCKSSCKCYTNVQMMNMYMLIVYIIHGPFGDIMLSHDLQLNGRCDFTYAMKVILVVNVDRNCLIVAN
jgi:hypothetical protein